VKIVLNADDFGSSRESVRATIECFQAGTLTSATIMAGMPAAAEAFAFAREHAGPGLSFGAHLTFSGQGVERPISSPDRVSTLVDAEGRFLPAGLVRRRALLGTLRVDEIEREAAAQLDLLRDHGVAASHVDSHQHLHKLAPFRSALERVLPSFLIERVRAVQNVFLARRAASATYWLGPLWQRSLARRFLTTDLFYIPTTDEQGWAEPLLNRLARLDGATLEVGVHPGQAPWQVEEQRSLLAFAEEARNRGHELVSWHSVGPAREAL
jgi:predicted glycoside hydrolase/deacetylase ChbG (UPF0249 family)